MAAWSGDLFVFVDAEGKEHVSAAPPAGTPIPASEVRQYRASGPRMPAGAEAPTAAGDTAAWMIEKQKEGFVFELVTDADYSKHYSEDSFWDKLAHFARQAGNEVVEKSLILFYVGNDPATPMWAKGVVGAALGYFIFPVDAIPDFVPFVGYADDLGAILSAIAAIATSITKEHRDKARAKTAEWFRGE
jgi:uncharacterized membrane protein YkvA (DUF1232 family)